MSRLAISNIAWDVAEDADIARLLGAVAIDAIDIAPGKYFPTLHGASANDIGKVRSWWADRGIEIAGMQSLLFGTKGLNLFGDASVQDAMLEHLTEVARIAFLLGASRLTFGSPANRNRTGLGDAETVSVAVDFFTRLGQRAADHGVVFCLEPNPVQYGCNFMTGADETAAIVRQIAHPAIRMQLDVGAIAINGEDVTAILSQHGTLIGHIHASEPNLVPLGEGSSDHRRAAAAVAAHLPDHIVTVEMRATDRKPHASAIGRALAFAANFYRDGRNAAGAVANASD